LRLQQWQRAFLTQGWYDNIIAVDPANPNTLWSGGIDLFRSDDSGQTWGIASYWWFNKASRNYAHADHHTIVFHPRYNGTSNQTMYVGNDGGIFTTANAMAAVSYSPNPITSTSPICGNPVANAVSWTALNNGYEVTQFYDGAVYPDNSTFFGGTQDNGTPRGTVAGGRDAWATILGGDGGYVAVNPGNTNMLWVENTGRSIGAVGQWWRQFFSIHQRDHGARRQLPLHYAVHPGSLERGEHVDGRGVSLEDDASDGQSVRGQYLDAGQYFPSPAGCVHRSGAHQFQHRVCGGPNRVHLAECRRPYGQFHHRLVLQPGPAG